MAGPGLDPLVHQPARLQILALLHRNRQVSAKRLTGTLGLTPGNAASHVGKLEAAGLVESRRVLTPTGFEVRHAITARGDAAFRAHVRALQALIRDADAERDAPAAFAPQKSARD